MRIAQVAPLHESVPPRYYGGTERVVSYLTEELVRMGHEVTLYASADSMTRARLRPQARQALRLDEQCLDPIPEHFLMLEQVFREAHEFDVIHFHTDYLHFPLCSRASVAHVTTLHGRLDLPHIERIFHSFRFLPFASISDAQRGPMPWLNWRRTIYHGLPEDLLEYVETPRPYLAFLGRISPEKRVDRAIEIARRVGIPIRIAAKIDKADREYFDAEIRALFQDPLVEYLGEIGEAEKSEFLGNALALLFPIDWPEPFGLVMIEAMACGTPIIAFPGGSVPEVIEHGKTGYVVHSIDEAVHAVERLDTLSRRQCRAVFEERFTARRMANDHVALYGQLMEDAHGYQVHAELGRTGSLSRTSALGSAR
jgi:glycosyltransferase involved in cell wall biosynthesis